jgi:branched-chain amino acid transport system permease protein
MGPIIGAMLFTGLPEFLRVSKALRMPIFGLILVFAILFMPKGIMQLKEMRWRTKNKG